MVSIPLSCFRRTVYGSNDIPVQVQSLLRLLLGEVSNPFYIFQLFTLCVWAVEAYYYYLIAIVLMTAFGVACTVLQTRKVSVVSVPQEEYMTSVLVCCCP
jgi:hypothetical protein